jgi:hypothetical protein
LPRLSITTETDRRRDPLGNEIRTLTEALRRND